MPQNIKAGEFMSLLNIIALFISIIWFILFVTKKYEKSQIWVFMLSHYVFYINIYILKNWDNLFTPIVIVCIAVLAFFINLLYFKNRNRISNFVYLIYTILLTLLIISVPILESAVSILNITH